MRPSERLFVNGFRSLCTVTIAEELEQLPEVEHIYWLRDALGAKDLPQSGKITILDSVATLHIDSIVRDPHELNEALRACFFAVRPAAIKMMNRLERYGPMVSSKKREEIFARNFFFSLELIEQEQITGFISSGVPHEVTDFIFSEVCRAKNVKTLVFFQVQTDLITTVPHYTNLGGRLMRTQGVASAGELEQRSLVMSNMYRQYRPEKGDPPVTPFYMKTASRIKVAEQQKQFRNQRIFGKIKGGLSKLFSGASWRYAYYLLYQKRVVEKRLTKRLWKNYHLKSVSPEVLDEPYVLLFLHYQPEMTTSPLAEEFVDQHKVAKLLIEALPGGVKLYVKEHPAQTVIGRTLDYYDQFPKDDRLVFISEKYSSTKLQNHAVAVATCTGTAGFEAVWSNIPVLVFGNSYYQGGPNVFRIRNKEEAILALTEIEGQKKMPFEGVFDTFIKGLVSRCRVGNLSDPYFWNSQLGLNELQNTSILVQEVQAWLNKKTDEQ